MSTKFVTATSKGQITLPAKWRKQFDTDNFLLEMREKRLVIQPVYLEKDEDDEEGWVAIWDSERDNNGVGIPAEDVIEMLEKMLDE